MYIDSYCGMTAKAVRLWFQGAGYGAGSAEPMKALFTWNGGRHSIELEALSGKLLAFRYSLRKGSGEPAVVDRLVALAWKPCPFGGERLYFVCPCCLKKAGVLRVTEQGPLCRRCAGTGYACQSEGRLDRAQRQERKARRRLPADGSKPRWMHWSTFDRLRQEARRRKALADEAWVASAMPKIERLEEQVARAQARVAQDGRRES